MTTYTVQVKGKKYKVHLKQTDLDDFTGHLDVGKKKKEFNVGSQSQAWMDEDVEYTSLKGIKMSVLDQNDHLNEREVEAVARAIYRQGES